jgi:hypothetical protein
MRAARPGRSSPTSRSGLGVKVVQPKAGKSRSACGQFYDAVTEQTLSHLDQAPLASALAGAQKRPLGDAWAWARRIVSVDISPLVASTLAKWGLGARSRKRAIRWTTSGEGGRVVPGKAVGSGLAGALGTAVGARVAGAPGLLAVGLLSFGAWLAWPPAGFLTAGGCSWPTRSPTVLLRSEAAVSFLGRRERRGRPSPFPRAADPAELAAGGGGTTRAST